MPRITAHTDAQRDGLVPEHSGSSGRSGAAVYSVTFSVFRAATKAHGNHMGILSTFVCVSARVVLRKRG